MPWLLPALTFEHPCICILVLTIDISRLSMLQVHQAGKKVSGVSNLLVSLGHTGRRRVVWGHTLNILWRVITKKSHNVLSKFTVLCWGTFIAILGCMWPVSTGLDTLVQTLDPRETIKTPVSLSSGMNHLHPALCSCRHCLEITSSLPACLGTDPQKVLLLPSLS